MQLSAFGFAENQTITTQKQEQIKILISLIEQQKSDISSKLQTLQSLHNMLTIAYMRANTNNSPIIQFAKQHIAHRINQKTNNQPSRYPKTIQHWIDKHNAVRQTPLQAHPALMQTAQLRADHLAQNNIKSNTHRRTTWNYNYTEIENRFYNQGIVFENRNRITFSESVAYGSVRCQIDNCDDILINNTEKSRNFFYNNEMKRKWPHYRAIIQENFNYIWIGIAINSGTYHIVIHYWTDIKEPVYISKK
jgi:hypothetical protein